VFFGMEVISAENPSNFRYLDTRDHVNRPVLGVRPAGKTGSHETAPAEFRWALRRRGWREFEPLRLWS